MPFLNFLRVLTFVSFVALFGSACLRSTVLICCIERLSRQIKGVPNAGGAKSPHKLISQLPGKRLFLLSHHFLHAFEFQSQFVTHLFVSVNGGLNFFIGVGCGGYHTEQDDSLRNHGIDNTRNKHT